VKTLKHTIIARSIATAFAGGVLLGAAPVRAQDDIQTVQVTAQSRRQSVKDVPITIQVVTTKDIEALGARDLSALNGYIPGLVVDAGEPTQPSFGIRGVQPGDFGIATDSPVGVYVDGVYTGKTGGALMNFVDVQRIEVLKGPQGTLFGRNSAAGAISIVTNTPSKQIEASGMVRVGNYGRRDADAMVNLPINDQSAVRMVFVRAHSDGWVDNKTLNRKSGGDQDWASRLSYQLNVGAAKFDLSLEHERMDQDGRPAFGVIKNPALPLGGYRGVYDAAYIKNFINPFNAPLENDNAGAEWREFNGATARLEFPLGAGMKFESSTGYRKFNSYNFTENDGGNRPDLSLNTLDAKNARSIQQEFKLSASSDKVDVVAGLSFFDNREHQDAGAYITTATIDTLSQFAGGAPNFAMLFGGLGQFGIPGASPSTYFSWDETHYSDVHTKASSLYGDAIWHLNPATNFTAGLRYSRDSKTMTWFVPGRVSPGLDQFLRGYGALAGLTPASFPANIVFDAAGALASKPVTRTKEWTDLSPRFVLDHKLSKDTLLFASLAQGYQAGGFNVFTPPNPNSANASDRDPSFSPEKMTNFEAGAKMSFPALKASLNASLFSYKFKNLQDISLYAVGAIPTYNVVSSDQKATGLDVDGRMRINSHVTVFGGFEYMDQTYSRYQRRDTSGAISLDLGGQPVGTPYFTGMGGVNFAWDMAAGRANWSFQGTHTSATRCNKDGADVGCITTAGFTTGGPTSKFDSRLAWDSEDHRYGVAVVVNNVFDKRYVTSLGGQTKQYGMPYASLTKPRTIALELRVSM
jgi:iron complex outermembrane receptor protein